MRGVDSKVRTLRQLGHGIGLVNIRNNGVEDDIPRSYHHGRADLCRVVFYSFCEALDGPRPIPAAAEPGPANRCAGVRLCGNRELGAEWLSVLRFQEHIPQAGGQSLLSALNGARLITKQFLVLWCTIPPRRSNPGQGKNLFGSTTRKAKIKARTTLDPSRTPFASAFATSQTHGEPDNSGLPRANLRSLSAKLLYA